MLLQTILALTAIGIVSANEYAVLVAGSRGYDNYRHQADVCHYYHSLVRRGIDPDNIVVMMYDDVATDPLNPIPNSLFNRPTPEGQAGWNVRDGCVVDYAGTNVTAANFLAVVTANQTALNGIGNGRFLKSGDRDNVLIYFTDHGGVGVLLFATGPELQARDLLNALDVMRQQRQYHRLVLDIEACESGSMVDALPAYYGVYSTTASTANQSSFATFCPPYDVVNGTAIGSCLGDAYSVATVSDIDCMPRGRTFMQQFVLVRRSVTSSQVMQFGDLSWTDLRASIVEGPSAPPLSESEPIDVELLAKSSVDARDVGGHLADWRLKRATTIDGRRQAIADVQKDRYDRRRTDRLFDDLRRTIDGWYDDRPAYTKTSAKTSDKTTAADRCAEADDCCSVFFDAIRTNQNCGGWTDHALRRSSIVPDVCSDFGGDHTPAITAAITAAVSAACARHPF